MNFEFPEATTVTLEHLNVRTEKHADANATALDLKFSRETGNDSLALFHPKLLQSLYYRAKVTTDQKEIEGVEKIAPNLRFPKLAPLAWDDEIVGARVLIEFGIDDDSAVLLTPAVVDKFRIECSEGGSVCTTFRVQCSNIPDGALDKLGKLLNSETRITIKKPDATAAGTVYDATPPADKKPEQQPLAPEQALARPLAAVVNRSTTSKTRQTKSSNCGNL